MRPWKMGELSLFLHTCFLFSFHKPKKKIRCHDADLGVIVGIGGLGILYKIIIRAGQTGQRRIVDKSADEQVVARSDGGSRGRRRRREQKWSRYPWGSYVWDPTIDQLQHALERRQNSGKPRYSLMGFTFAFKIWIYEIFPFLRSFADPTDRLPRAVAWNRKKSPIWLLRINSYLEARASPTPSVDTHPYGDARTVVDR